MPFDTDIDMDENDVVGAEIGNDVWLVVDALTLLQVPMKSSLLTEDKIYDVQGALFIFALRRHQKIVIFRRCRTCEPYIIGSSIMKLNLESTNLRNSQSTIEKCTRRWRIWAMT